MAESGVATRALNLVRSGVGQGASQMSGVNAPDVVEQMHQKRLAAGGSPHLMRESFDRGVMERSSSLAKVENRVESEMMVPLEALASVEDEISRTGRKFGIARFPKIDPERWKTDALVRLFLLLDLLTNGALYGAYAPSIFEGLGYAFGGVVMMFVTVVAAVLCARHATVGSRIRRAMGFLGAGMMFASCVASLFAAAHFRESVVDGIDGYRSFVHHAIAAPTDLGTQSWMMFAITCALAVLLFYKLFSGRDSVPGFESLGRKRIALLEELNKLHSQFSTEIQTVFEECGAKVGETQMFQRKKLDEAIEFGRRQLRKRGVRNPEAYESSGGESEEVLDLLDEFNYARSWLRSNHDQGDMQVQLSGIGSSLHEEEPEEREIEDLASARTLKEGKAWLRRLVDAYGFDPEKKTGGEVG